VGRHSFIDRQRTLLQESAQVGRANEVKPKLVIAMQYLKFPEPANDKNVKSTGIIEEKRDSDKERPE
jgi:hypothetical protein